MDWAMKTYGLSGDVGTFEGVLSKPYWDQVGGMTQKTGENIEFIHQSIGKELPSSACHSWEDRPGKPRKLGVHPSIRCEEEHWDDMRRMKNRASEKGKLLDQVGKLNTIINCTISNIRIMRGRGTLGASVEGEYYKQVETINNRRERKRNFLNHVRKRTTSSSVGGI